MKLKTIQSDWDWDRDQTLVESAYSDNSSLTVTERGLHRRKLIHALMISILPTLGLIASVVLIFFWGIGWMEITLLLVMYAATTTGMEVGYHRLFTHKSFATKNWIRGTLLILGSMCAQGPVINWVSTHRRHHQYSDRPEDPHSPNQTGEHKENSLLRLWHAYVGWIYTHDTSNPARFALDLMKDPFIFRLNRLYLWWVLLGLAIPTVIGGIWTLSWQGSLLGFLWGGLTRLFFVHQATFAVTSFCHLFGSRPFSTKEESRNNPWFALQTFGQAWHNNHHAFPSSAIMGFHWYQIDLGGYVIRLLQFANLAWAVKQPDAKTIKARMQIDHSNAVHDKG